MQIAMILEELEKGAAVIQALCDNLSDNEARSKPDASSWSILEVVCHLVDEESEDFRQHLDQAFHRQNDVWHPIDPERWVSERNYNQQDLKNKLVEFSQEREKSLNWLRSLDSINLENKTNAPFGEIAAGDLLAAWVMHDNLHIRQLTALRTNIIKRKSSPYNTRYAGEW